MMLLYGEVFGVALWVWEIGWGRREVRGHVSGLAAGRVWGAARWVDEILVQGQS